MLTVRQMERLWDAGKYPQLLDQLIGMRVEAMAAGDLGERTRLAAAALALIRLDELNQSHATICPKLIRAIIASAEGDGGWGDVMITSLCLRALALANGGGAAIDRGMAYLALLQQQEGIWPRIPLRRMSADATVSAFVLLQLGDNESFGHAVNLSAAARWFETHGAECDSAAKTLWGHAKLRLPTAGAKQAQFIWS